MSATGFYTEDEPEMVTQRTCTCVYLALSLQPAFYTQFVLKRPSQQYKVHSAASALYFVQ